MQWSQLKKRMEQTFAETVSGRLEVWVTRYRHAHHDAGEAWITLDKRKMVTMGNLRHQIAQYEIAHRLQAERNCTDYQDPNQYAGYHEASKQAAMQLHDAGIFDSQHLPRAMLAYLNL